MAQPELDEPLVTVVVPTLDEERSLSTCLDSVLAQSWRNLEVLVVDGGSTDRTLALAEEYRRVDDRVRIVANPRRTQSAAMNTATDAASSDWLVRVDAHSTVTPDYVRGVMAHLVTGKWGGVGGRKDGVATTSQGRAIAAALGSRFGVGGSTYHHGTEVSEIAHIPFGAYPVEVIRDVGGWDESIGANEDFEFDYRVRMSGRSLLFDPSLVIFWETRQRVGDFFQQYRRYGRGKGLVIAKHPSSAKPQHLAPAALVAGLAVGVALAPVKPRLAAAAILPYLAGLGVATAAVAPRVADPAARKWLLPAFAAMHLGYGLGTWETTLAGRLPNS